MSAKSQPQSDGNTNYTGVGLAIGLAIGAGLGVTLGIALGNMAFMAIFVGAGMSIGLAIGAGLQQSKEQSTENEPLPSHDRPAA